MASRAVACSTARPPATTLVTRSRSVTIPISRLDDSDSTTGTDPTSSFFISDAIRVTGSSGSQQTGSGVITSVHLGIWLRLDRLGGSQAAVDDEAVVAAGGTLQSYGQ